MGTARAAATAASDGARHFAGTALHAPALQTAFIGTDAQLTGHADAAPQAFRNEATEGLLAARQFGQTGQQGSFALPSM